MIGPTTDLRHMVDAGKCESLSAFQELVRFTGAPSLSRATGPGPSFPDRGHTWNTAAIKAGRSRTSGLTPRSPTSPRRHIVPVP